MKTNIIDISPTHMAKFWVSSYGPKCCQPIILQDSLECSIERNDEIYFLHADKHRSLLQGDNIIFVECNHACPKYSK